MQRITQIVPHYAGMIGRNLGAVAAPRTTAAACALTSTSAAAAAAKAVVWLRRLVRVRAILFTPAQAIFPPSLSQSVENIRVTRNVTMQPNSLTGARFTACRSAVEIVQFWPVVHCTAGDTSDIRYAFHSISHEKLWFTVLDMGYPTHLVRILSTLFKKQLAKVRESRGHQYNLKRCEKKVITILRTSDYKRQGTA